MISMSEVDKIIRRVLESNDVTKEDRLLCMAILELMNDVKSIKRQMAIIRWLLGSILFMLIINIIGIKMGW